ncbi:hypothetical protein TNCT_467641, partial [Trichonephila clavata]
FGVGHRDVWIKGTFILGNKDVQV